MRRYAKLIAIGFGFMLGCRGPVDTSLPSIIPGDSTLAGTHWKLRSYVTAAPGAMRIYPTAYTVTLQFDSTRASLGGHGPCNSYGGDYRTTSGSHIAIGDSGIVQTLIYCSYSDNAEKTYFGALRAATSYSFHDSTLTLVTADATMSLLDYIRQRQ